MSDKPVETPPLRSLRSVEPMPAPIGPPTSAVISRIENELRQIWATPASPGEMPKSRAVTMNLVVVAGTHEIAERYTSIVDEVIQGLPARAIVVALDPNATHNGLEGEVTAVCGPGEGGAAVCSERVRLGVSGEVCARVGSALEALCLPEIPTALVWLGRVHVEDPVFLSVAFGAQRIVLDTEYTSITSLLSLARWSRSGTGRPHFADLAWTRLSVWQELCARFFDEPQIRDLANSIVSVTLHQASDRGARLGAEGALLLGWLATRLGWKPSRMGGALRFTRPDGGHTSIKLDVTERLPGVAPAAISSIVIEATTKTGSLRGSIVRERGVADASTANPPSEADVLVWKMETSTQTPREHRVRLGANRGSKVLLRTLHRPAEDPTLNDAVAFAEEVFEDSVTCG